MVLFEYSILLWQNYWHFCVNYKVKFQTFKVGKYFLAISVHFIYWLSAINFIWPFTIISAYGKDSVYKEYTFIHTMQIENIVRIRINDQDQISIHRELKKYKTRKRQKDSGQIN